MGVAAVVLGLVTSFGLLESSISLNPGFEVIDMPGFFMTLISVLGSLLSFWVKALAVILLVLVAIAVILIGYFTTNINMIIFGIGFQITAILATARKPRTGY